MVTDKDDGNDPTPPLRGVRCVVLSQQLQSLAPGLDDFEDADRNSRTKRIETHRAARACHAASRRGVLTLGCRLSRDSMRCVG